MEELNNQVFKLKNQQLVQMEQTNKYKEDYLELTDTLQKHDYSGCECMLKFVPAVDKALNQPRRLRMGPRAEGVIGRLRNKESEQKEEI